MQYFSDMLSKYGFSDGNAVPCGMKHFRDIYIEALNRLLPELGSNIRVVPFDRGGLHNWCMILPVLKETFEKHGIDVANSSVQLPHIKDEIDEAYHKAVLMAGEMQLDELVIVEARKVLDYQEQIEDLVASALEEQEG